MRNKLRKTRVLLLLCLWAIPFMQLLAQDIEIKGKVTDAVTKEAIIGANITVKGTSKGALSNIDGDFVLLIPVGSTINISFLGYNAQNIVAESQTLSIELEPSVQKLDEVIVIGYGTQKKSDKTGAVTNVSAAELNTGVLTDPIQSLQGKASGVQITKKGGNPNDGFSVQIRGSASFGSNQPLYVIDGVPGVDPTTIASDDIESFNVLKDASSSAIYGSRGANGVIIITSKKGKSGASKIDFNSFVSLDVVSKKLDLLSASDIRSFITQNNISQVDAGASTDWQNEIYRVAKTQNYSLSVAGGSDKSTYRVSGTWADYQGVVIGTDKKRFNMSANVNQKLLNDKLIIEGGINGTFEKNDYEDFGGNGPTDIMYQAFQRSPLQPVRNDDGTFYENIGYGFQYFNPIATVNSIQNIRDAKRFRANASSELEILKGLKAKVSGAYSRDDDESFYFVPGDAPTSGTTGKGERKYNNIEDKLIEAYATYETKIASKHNVNFVAGYSWQQKTFDGFNAMGTNAQSPSVEANKLQGLANVTWGSIGSYKNSWTMISAYGRFIYNYDQRYALTATLRQDGCSKFGANNKWGTFPSGSVAWTLKNESFLKDVNFLSQLKLRVGYGLTGNAETLESYWSIQRISANAKKISLDDGSNVILFQQDWDANPNLRWENTEEINIGLDYGFFNNKVQGSIEVYNRTINDLIYKYSVPQPPSPTGNVYANAGQFRNRGIEVNTQLQVINKQKLTYKTSLIYSRNISKVLNLSDEANELRWKDKIRYEIQARGMVGQKTQILDVGYSLGTWYLPHFVRFSSDGAMLYETEAGGVTRDFTKAALKNAGSAMPKHNIGWSNYFTIFKNIDVTIALHAVLDYKVYNVSDMYFSNPTLLPNFNANQQAVDWYEGKIDGTPVASDYWLEDGSFIRLDNVTIGYTLPMPKKFKISTLRISCTANNLLTITNYTGIDPELSYNNVDFGLDNFNVYPKVRSFVFGVQLTF